MDCLAIGAHPDDCELMAGATLAALAAAGRRVGMLHLTRGELGSRGTPEGRREEANEAARLLGLAEDDMEILDLGDGRLDNSPENRLEIIRRLRRWRPRLVLHHHPFDRHPDHGKAARLAAEACFYSRLTKIETGQPPFAPARRLAFLNNSLPQQPPSLVVDVSPHFQTKLQALAAYRSQLHQPGQDEADSGPRTFISSPEFRESIEIRARFWGGLIGARHGEAFHADPPLGVHDPCHLLPPED